MGVKRSTAFLCLLLMVASCHLSCEAVHVSSSEEIMQITEEPTASPEPALSDRLTNQKEDCEPNGPIQEEEVASLKERVSILLDALTEHFFGNVQVDTSTDATTPESRSGGTSFPIPAILGACTNNPNLCQNGQCVNSTDGYHCECDLGFERNEDGDGCVDIDECNLPDLSICANGECRNFAGSFNCYCNEGYELDILAVDCTANLGACTNNPNLCQNGQCVNSTDGYHCECDLGFERNEDGDGCVDIDECNLPDLSICANGECRNFAGSFNCYCNEGYELDILAVDCTDVDECQQPDVYCDNGYCTNTIGSYTCECPMGTRLFWGTECSADCLESDDNFYDVQLPLMHGESEEVGDPSCPATCTCVNGRIKCVVPQCVGPDVCEANPNLCYNATCVSQNDVGSYYCECDFGYVYRGGEGCQDIDECSLFTLNFCDNGECRNIPGGYTCDCDPGFENEEISGLCMDVDECQQPDVYCVNGYCTNTIGSYTCECPVDTTLFWGRECSADCLESDDNFYDMQLPLMHGESEEVGDPSCPATCTCENGMIHCSVPQCVGPDVCEANPNLCYNTTCVSVNRDGYYCECDLGFRYIHEEGCQDVDECEQPDVYCPDGNCTNSIGSYSCQCPDGYLAISLDGVTGTRCIDLDELLIALPQDCSDVTLRAGSGVYTMTPIEGEEAIDVFCDFDTAHGPWTVIQRRQDGSVNFYRQMADYKAGFGDLGGEFWLGLDKIYNFVSRGSHQLRIDLQDGSGTRKFAIYDDFSISDESDGYRLSVGRYSGNARNSLAYHNGMQFTTSDVDKDMNTNKNCARFYKGAWWYKKCLRSNLNGRYRDPAKKHPDGLIWAFWKGYTESMTFVEMKIRRI